VVGTGWAERCVILSVAVLQAERRISDSCAAFRNATAADEVLFTLAQKKTAHASKHRNVGRQDWAARIPLPLRPVAAAFAIAPTKPWDRRDG
jgi:hypothetical protein